VNALLGAGLHKGFACGVWVNDYEMTVPRWMREQLGLATPYEFAVHACMGVASKWAQDIGVIDPIQYVIEHGEGKEGNFQQAFNNASAIPQARQFFRLGRLIFDTKEGAIGLQAADMLANYFWAWQIGNRPLVEPYSRIVNAPNIKWEVFDKARILEQIEIDKAGRTTATADGTIYRKTPEPIDIEVEADFTEAENMLAQLESFADTHPKGIHSLIKHSSRFEKLFTVNSENSSTPQTNNLRISFKPNDFTLSAVAAIRASETDGDLSEGEVSHEN
jgi:hypothetical protein